MVNGKRLIVQFRGASQRFGRNPRISVPVKQAKAFVQGLQRQGLEVITSFTAGIARRIPGRVQRAEDLVSAQQAQLEQPTQVRIPTDVSILRGEDVVSVQRPARIVGRVRPAPTQAPGFIRGLGQQVTLIRQRLRADPTGVRTQELRGRLALSAVLPEFGIGELISLGQRGQVSQLQARTAGRAPTLAERAELFARQTLLPSIGGVAGGLGARVGFRSLGRATARRTAEVGAISEPTFRVAEVAPRATARDIQLSRTRALARVQESPFFGVGPTRESIVGIRGVSDVARLPGRRGFVSRSQFETQVRGEPQVLRGGIEEVVTRTRAPRTFAGLGRGEIQLPSGVRQFRTAGLVTRIRRTPTQDIFGVLGETGRTVSRRLTPRARTLQAGIQRVIRPARPTEPAFLGTTRVRTRARGVQPPPITAQALEQVAVQTVRARPTPRQQARAIFSPVRLQNQVSARQFGPNLALQRNIAQRQTGLTGLVQRQRLRPTQRVAQRVDLRQRGILATTTVQAQVQRQATQQRQRQQLRQGIGLRSLQQQRQEQRQTLTTSFFPGSPFGPLSSILPSGLPPLGLPSFELEEKRRKRARRRARQRTRTLPGFTEISLGIIGDLPPRGRALSGFEQRAIPRGVARQLGLI